MKLFLVVSIFLCLSSGSYAQKLKILLIGASHDYSKSLDQNLLFIYERVRAFKPEASFGEFLSPEDEAKLMDYWCKSDNLKRLTRLKATRHIPVLHLKGIIDSLKTISKLDINNFYLKADLAHAYYLAQDVSNGHYLYWQIYDQLKNFPDNKLEKYVDDLLCPKQDISGRSMKRLKTSEYALIAFPMMRELRIEKMYAMDCQDFDLNWTASAVAFHDKFETFQQDTLASNYNSIAYILGKRKQGFIKYAEKERSSPNFTEWLNTNDAANILTSGDFYFPELYNFKNFPREEMLSQLHWWRKRNEGMCQNVLNRSKEINARQVVVFVGANHKKLMQEIFNAIPGIEVFTLNVPR